MDRNEKVELMLGCYCKTRFNSEYYTNIEKYHQKFQDSLKILQEANFDISGEDYSQICRILDNHFRNKK